MDQAETSFHYSRRCLTKCLTAAAALWLIACLPAMAQSEPFERDASAQEISGNWKMLPLPTEIEPSVLKASPWPAPCQWYSYSPAGWVKSIDRTPAPCEVISSAQLDEALTQVPAVAFWKYDVSPAFQKALVIVNRTDVKGYAEYWVPHIVMTDFSKAGADFKRGDLIFYLANLQTHQIVWVRHLRRLE